MSGWVNVQDQKPTGQNTVWAWLNGKVVEVNALHVGGPYFMGKYWQPIPWPKPPNGLAHHPDQVPVVVVDPSTVKETT